MIGPGVVERLDAEPVARQQQPSALPVPQRKRKHPLEPLDAALPFLLVQMQYRLGVAAGAIAVTALLQPEPQVGVVVDFAIVDDPHRPILVGHRLTASEHIHNPSPSGPRWRSTSRIRLRRASSTVSRWLSLTMPTIPHMPSSSTSRDTTRAARFYSVLRWPPESYDGPRIGARGRPTVQGTCPCLDRCTIATPAHRARAGPGWSRSCFRA